MCSREESSPRQTLDAVFVRSSADTSKVNSLLDELKHPDIGLSIGVIAAHAEADLETVLCHFSRRCVVYLSPQSVSDRCKSTVLRFARREGRDAVVVVMDDALPEAPPDEWADLLCLRYMNQSLKELCRELAVLIRTPLLHCRPEHITGYAVAFRVLNGYLRLVLPNFHERLKELYPTIYASCVKKLLIICPESCRCPPSMKIEGSIEPAEGRVLRNVTRAGQEHRDFSTPVYRIRDKENNRDYYFPATFDNSLVSLSDIQRSGWAGVDESRMYTERNYYILHLQQLLQQSKDARKFSGQYRILFWRDSKVTLDDFLLPIVREELESEPVEVFESTTDFQFVDGPGVNPGSLYANPAECYKLSNRYPKGICLIINNEFESPAMTNRPNDVPQTLYPRSGSEVDVRKLTDVFRWLKFDVEVHRNVNKLDFLRIINEIREHDHKTYGAFVCCIMSHGYLGHIYAADSQPIGILEDVANTFYPESCPTLAGKPKIFFIQSCQISGVCGSVADEGNLSAPETTIYESDADKCAAVDTGKRTLLLPDAPDFFMSYSTLPRSPSFRHQDDGSFYVQALTDVLKKGMELQASLYEVAQRVEQKAADSGMTEQQRPFFHVSTHHKSVFLCGKMFII